MKKMSTLRRTFRKTRIAGKPLLSFSLMEERFEQGIRTTGSKFDQSESHYPSSMENSPKNKSRRLTMKTSSFTRKLDDFENDKER